MGVAPLATATSNSGRLTIANAALFLAHSCYELAGGVGLPGQKVLGLSGAAAAHAGLVAAWISTSRRRSTSAKRAVALLNGLGLAGAATHYVAWPTRWNGPFPVLVEGAEGLRQRWTHWYNALLYAWGTSAALAVVLETSSEQRSWAVAGLCSAPLVAAASHGKHDWVRDQARLRPRWWNRALLTEGGEGG